MQETIISVNQNNTYKLQNYIDALRGMTNDWDFQIILLKGDAKIVGKKNDSKIPVEYLRGFLTGYVNAKENK